MRIYDAPIAHRGLHGEGVPENSFAAYQQAIDAGYNIEIDVRLLRDGKIAVFHDANLKRVVGKDIKVSKLTSEDLKKPEYLLPNGEEIPLFEDLLRFVDGKVDILCELKSGAYKKFILEEGVYALIKGKDWITVQSFNPLSIAWFNNNANEIPRGQLATKAKNVWLKMAFKIVNPYRSLERGKPEFLAYDVRYLPSERIQKALKDYHLKLITWTVNSEEYLQRAAENGAVNVIFEHVVPDGFPKK